FSVRTDGDAGVSAEARRRRWPHGSPTWGHWPCGHAHVGGAPRSFGMDARRMLTADARSADVSSVRTDGNAGVSAEARRRRWPHGSPTWGHWPCGYAHVGGASRTFGMDARRMLTADARSADVSSVRTDGDAGVSAEARRRRWPHGSPTWGLWPCGHAHVGGASRTFGRDARRMLTADARSADVSSVRTDGDAGVSAETRRLWQRYRHPTWGLWPCGYAHVGGASRTFGMDARRMLSADAPSARTDGDAG